MILEDNESNADLISFYLKEEGFETAVAATGSDFVNRVAAYGPDLITIDILLPDADGLEVFQELLQEKRTKDIPVVFVTVEEAKQKKGLEMGACGFITKPFTEKTLKEVIKSVFARESSDEKDPYR